ncbi:PTS-dependent dihydroxyacetone kinase phosphotransferase subunit DhaM [Providencia stuartii]|nr:PTS-dependent dihydroxyacetone kinase phosphotransferase subunit DhaM [Providencia stuartii]ELR5123471.1 PTS-dependent dihydroxyacetone kinase phosphotransferase subunit DhaM [Providencia stuartii]
MIGLIIVSHSKLLADGVLQLAEQIQNKQHCQIITAAGVDDDTHPIGTDAVKVMEAIETLADATAIILLMDLGSALLSAETALDLIDAELAKKVHLCSAPLVEGAIAITASASTGTSIDTILNEARQALYPKQQQLNEANDITEKETPAPSSFSEKAMMTEWLVQNPSGLHIRPAAKLATLLSGFKAKLELQNNEKRADAKSMNQIALLQVHQGDKIRLIAEGVDSQEAIDAFNQLAQQHFGDNISTSNVNSLIGKAAYVPSVTGFAYHIPENSKLCTFSYQGSKHELETVTQAIKRLQRQLNTLADSLAETYGKEIANIFHGHSVLLDDDDLIDSIKQKIEHESITAYDAISQVFSEISAQYQQLDDDYLQARFIDIDDLKNQLLMSISSASSSPLVLSEPTILLTHHLGPSELLHYNNANVVGIALAQGSPYSHTCIIATKMGIPILVNLGEKIDEIPENAKLTLSVATETLTIEAPISA